MGICRVDKDFKEITLSVIILGNCFNLPASLGSRTRMP